MESVQSVPDLEQVVQQLDQLIAEMMSLRRRVAALSGVSFPPGHSVRELECFGMWADREDMRQRSSREWLEQLRAQRNTEVRPSRVWVQQQKH